MSAPFTRNGKSNSDETTPCAICLCERTHLTTSLSLSLSLSLCLPPAASLSLSLAPSLWDRRGRHLSLSSSASHSLPHLASLYRCHSTGGRPWETVCNSPLNTSCAICHRPKTRASPPMLWKALRFVSTSFIFPGTVISSPSSTC